MQDVQDIQVDAELNVLNELHSVISVFIGKQRKTACNMASMNQCEHFPAE